MSNDFYNPTGNPGPRASGASATMRAEFIAAQAGFDKLLGLVGKAGQIPRVNVGETAQEGILFDYGSYTPALIGTPVNMSVTSMALTRWLRLHDWVFLMGRFASAGGTTAPGSFDFSLPIASTLPITTASTDRVVGVVDVDEGTGGPGMWAITNGASNSARIKVTDAYLTSAPSYIFGSFLCAYPVV